VYRPVTPALIVVGRVAWKDPRASGGEGAAPTTVPAYGPAAPRRCGSGGNLGFARRPAVDRPRDLHELRAAAHRVDVSGRFGGIWKSFMSP
jgi:hypothetical protein